MDTVARLLTAPRPASPALALPVVLLATVVTLGVALALGRRAPARVAPLVGAGVLYGSALLLTAGTADRGPVGVGLVALTAAGWLLLDGDALVSTRDRPALGRAEPVRRARWRATGVTGLVLVALVSTAGLASAGAVTGTAFEPRAYVTPPRVPVDAVHPLSEVSRWQSDADATVLRVGGTHPGYLSWVALPDFDGAGWSADLDLRELGTVVEPSLAPGAVRGRVDVEVQLVGLAGPSGSPGAWLPSVGDAAATTVRGALVDVDTGVLAAPVPVDGRLPAGLAYRVSGTVDLPDADRAARAGVPGGPEVDRYLRVDRMPPDLRVYAQDAVAGAVSRLDQAERLAAVVRDGRALAVDAVSGSSYARVREFLFADASAGGQVGTTEQFAGTFAVLARAVGLPSRVVVGFRVPGGAAAGGELRDVHGEDVRAWAEVYLAGTGWVRFDPAPDAASVTGLPAPTRELAPEPVGEVPADAAEPEGTGPDGCARDRGRRDPAGSVGARRARRDGDAPGRPRGRGPGDRPGQARAPPSPARGGRGRRVAARRRVARAARRPCGRRRHPRRPRGPDRAARRGPRATARRRGAGGGVRRVRARRCSLRGRRRPGMAGGARRGARAALGRVVEPPCPVVGRPGTVARPADRLEATRIRPILITGAAEPLMGAYVGARRAQKSSALSHRDGLGAEIWETCLAATGSDPVGA